MPLPLAGIARAAGRLATDAVEAVVPLAAGKTLGAPGTGSGLGALGSAMSPFSRLSAAAPDLSKPPSPFAAAVQARTGGLARLAETALKGGGLSTSVGLVAAPLTHAVELAVDASPFAGAASKAANALAPVARFVDPFVNVAATLSPQLAALKPAIDDLARRGSPFA